MRTIKSQFNWINICAICKETLNKWHFKSNLNIQKNLSFGLIFVIEKESKKLSQTHFQYRWSKISKNLSNPIKTFLGKLFGLIQIFWPRKPSFSKVRIYFEKSDKYFDVPDFRRRLKKFYYRIFSNQKNEMKSFYFILIFFSVRYEFSSDGYVKQRDVPLVSRRARYEADFCFGNDHQT